MQNHHIPVPRRILVVYNPTAGRRRSRHLEAVLSALNAAGCSVSLHATRGRGDAEAIARTLTSATYDVVVAAGGDGTINEVANGLAVATGAVPLLALIPLGTANVLAHELGLPASPAAQATLIATGKATPVWLGRANGRCFTMMAGAWFDARVVETVSTALKRRLGRLAYVVATLSQAMRYGFPPMVVEIDGHSHAAMGVVVCNGRHYGGPFVAAPSANLGAPSLEVCLLGRGGWRSVLRYAVALAAGRLHCLADVQVVTGHTIRIEAATSLPVQADGDVVAHLPAVIDMAPHPLAVIASPPY